MENTTSHKIAGILRYTHECMSITLKTSELVSTGGFRDIMLLAASPQVLEGGRINARMLQKLGTSDVHTTDGNSSRGALVMS